jgi:hypothetical protein
MFSKKLIIIFTIILTIGIVFNFSKNMQNNQENTEDKKILSLGSTNSPSGITNIWTLFESGRLRQLNAGIESETKINNKSLEKIKNILENLLNKECPEEPPVPDFSQTLSINYLDQTKLIKFPSCQEEMGEIEALLMMVE